MSLGLLGAYGSGADSSSSGESDDETAAPVKTEEEPPPAPMLTNPFKTGSAPSSSSSSVPLQLPRPSFLTKQEDLVRPPGAVSNTSSSSSVFRNPFREREDAKRAVLEKHVAMTVRPEELRKIDGKKICWNFRKGRCRFGHKCTFAHDSDIGLKKPDPGSFAPDIAAQPSASEAKPQVANASASAPAPPPRLAAATPPHPKQSYDQGSFFSGEDSQGFRKKKRPGLSQDLTPSKKAMKFHNRVYNGSEGGGGNG